MDLPQLANPVRILIVDDHPNTAGMLARVLSKFETPVDVITAASSEEALERAAERPVDILITDFMMPGLNGLELIERLQAIQKLAHTILITAYDTPGLAITARRLKVQEYLVKPVQPERIRNIVAKMLEELRPAAGSEPIPQTKRGYKILVADDYPDNLRLLSTRLQNEGYTFLASWDGEETLRSVRKELPDLVLLDVNMPNKDGFEVLAEMRADPAIAHIPVIMITAARINPRDVRQGLSLGADDYVIKPFDWRELAARIQSKLRVKQAEDILRQRTRELGILPEIGQQLSARLDVEEVARIVVERTVEALDASSARLDVFEPDGSMVCLRKRQAEQAVERLNASRETVMGWGVVYYIVTTHQGIVIENTRADTRWAGRADEAAAAVVGVPLLGRTGVIGVLTLLHPEREHFTLEHQTLLNAIASQASIAIENAQLFGAERQRVQELMALTQFTQEIHAFTHTRQLMDGLPGLMIDKFGYQAAAAWEVAHLDDNQGVDVRLASLHSLAGELERQDWALIARQAVVSGRTALASDAGRGPSAAAAPLSQGGKVVGALAVYHPGAGMFQEKDSVLLETMASQVVSALERISLFESVEHEQRRLLAVLRSAADAILVMDGQGRLTLANPTGERLFSGGPGNFAAAGQPLPAGQGYEDLIALLDEARSAGSNRQGEVSWPDGRTFAVLAAPVEDEYGQVVVLHDISQFKALNALKNEYIATASHDLKNPIMALMGYNDLLAKAGPLNPMQEEFTKRIAHAALQMRELVLNLLEMSRLESGAAMKHEKVDLHALLDALVQDFGEQARSKGHTISLRFNQTPVFVWGDPILLQQMASNLLGNALKYTLQNGQIVVGTRLEGERVLLDIQDNGLGMPAEALPNLFTKFYRVQTDETRDIEGTGLGLAIVKSIVENHGGWITVESQLGRGTRFIVNLPAEIHN